MNPAPGPHDWNGSGAARFRLNAAQRAVVTAALAFSLLLGLFPPWAYREVNKHGDLWKMSARGFVLAPPENRISGTPGDPYDLDLGRLLAEQGLILLWCGFLLVLLAGWRDRKETPT